MSFSDKLVAEITLFNDSMMFPFRFSILALMRVMLGLAVVALKRSAERSAFRVESWAIN